MLIHTYIHTYIYIYIVSLHEFFLNIKYFSIHMGRGEKVLKKLIVVYIQNDLTLE